MKLAHIAVVSPGRCGLYETTRELVTALRQAGVDSRICDPTLDTNTLHPKAAEDRGALFADEKWAIGADVLVNHSGLGERLEQTEQPVIHIAHGRPRSSFLSEVSGGTPIYSYHYHKSKDKRFRSVVTFWPEHEPYLRVMWPDTPIHVLPAPVDLDHWTPHGPNGYKFHGMGGKVNMICTDAWRDDVDPFAVVNAFALYARGRKGVKLHIYGNSKHLRGWSALLKRIQDDGNLGEVLGWVKGLEHVYRSSSLTLTPHRIAVRSIRESMATGCPVASMGAQDPYTFGNQLDEALAQDRGRVREKAEQRFNPRHTAEKFLSVVKEID